MAVNVNSPSSLKIPRKFFSEPELRAWAEQLQTILFQLSNRTGGYTDDISDLIVDNQEIIARLDAVEAQISEINISISDIEAAITTIQSDITALQEAVEAITRNNEVLVKSSSDLSGILSATKEYFIDGVIDMTGVEVTVPSGGLSIRGYNFDVSQLVCTDDNYELFKSTSGGNVSLHDVGITVSGTSSAVFNLVPVDSNRAIEIISTNFNDCTSLGEIQGYRQYFESGTGRFGGTPELTLSGSMNGVRVTSSIVRGLDNITSLFKAGTGLTFSGRFISDMNVDLPTTGALINFSDTNITNDESLEFVGAYVTRSGAIDPTDTAIFPNIDADNVKAKWKSNTGLPNTNKYLNTDCTTEVETVITASSTFYPLLGTFTVNDSVHFDMPANGEFRLLTGYGAFSIIANLVIEGTANNEIEVRVTKSTDGGTTFPTEINQIKRTINNLSGSRDVAFFPINFIATLAKDDRLRLEVENTSGTGNVTMELASYFMISEV